MAEENISQEFRLNIIEETRNIFIKELDQDGLISKKDKKVCRTLNCIEEFLILDSVVNGCISILAFASLQNCRN